MDPEKRIRFAELLELHISNIIKKRFVNEQLTPVLMRQIRETIREQITTVFDRGNHKLEVKSITWLTDQYFKAVKLNSELMEELIILNEYKLTELPYHDIQLLRNLFTNTRLSAALDEEYVRRSQS